MAKVNNYIFIMTADGKEAQGGSGSSCTTKDFVTKQDIEKTRTFVDNFLNYCEKIKHCEECEYYSSSGRHLQCFKYYLDKLEGKINEG